MELWLCQALAVCITICVVQPHHTLEGNWCYFSSRWGIWAHNLSAGSRVAQLVWSRMSWAQDPKAMTPSKNTIKRATPSTEHFLHFHSVAWSCPRKEALFILIFYLLQYRGGSLSGARWLDCKGESTHRQVVSLIPGSRREQKEVPSTLV